MFAKVWLAPLTEWSTSASCLLMLPTTPVSGYITLSASGTVIITSLALLAFLIAFLTVALVPRFFLIPRIKPAAFFNSSFEDIALTSPSTIAFNGAVISFDTFLYLLSAICTF